MKRTTYEVYDREDDPMIEIYDTTHEAAQRLLELEDRFPTAHIVRTVRTRVDR